MEKKFDEYNDKTAKAYKYQATLLDSNKFFVEVAGIIMFILLILIFIDKVETNFISLISVYAAAAFRFLPSINRLIVAAQKIRFAAPSVNKIIEEIEILARTKNSEDKKIQKSLNFNEKFELKNINFNFSEKNKIIQNLNLIINKYDKVGIKGPSGSGKSTLLHLISGLISPQSGEIFVDNKIANISDESWYKKIGYAPQFINLIDDTIKENIIYGLDIDNHETIDKKINEISKVCLLDEFIDKTTHKFETIVGENGLKISGGQKQRIGIARSIFRNPELLILDESTSSLDSEAENQLLKNLFSYESKKTLVIASHKDTTLNL
jgi:ABC-type multidrug transport system fused ATPase/permease subunit